MNADAFRSASLGFETPRPRLRGFDAATTLVDFGPGGDLVEFVAVRRHDQDLRDDQDAQRISL